MQVDEWTARAERGESWVPKNRIWNIQLNWEEPGIPTGKAAGVGNFSLTALEDWGTLFQTQTDVTTS